MRIIKNRTYKRAAKGIIMLMLLFVFTIMIPAEAQAAKLNKTSLTLLKGRTYTLKLTGTNKKANWKSSQKKVVKVISKSDKKAKVKAVKTGNATITAKIGKKSYECKIKVVDPTLSSIKLTIINGDTTTLKVKGGTGTVKWKSSNPAVITVNSQGMVTAVKSGKAKIMATQNGKKMTCAVTVEKKQVQKKRWVATKEARTVYTPVYETVGYIECLTCGETFEGEGMGEAYDEHESNHLQNGEPGQYTIKSRKTLIRIDATEYPEEGYWETYWVYE